MSSFNWQAVVDIVEKEFPTYIPVPSRDVEDYRIFNFLCLAKTGTSGPPSFYFCGNECDVAYLDPSMKKPEVTAKKVWACDECAIKPPETSVRPFDLRASPEDMTFSLGTISEHRVSYKNLETWLCGLGNVKDDALSLVRDEKLFIIHTAIVAEKLVIKEGGEESRFGDLNRPKEFGGFLLGSKLVKYW